MVILIVAVMDRFILRYGHITGLGIHADTEHHMTIFIGADYDAADRFP